MLKVRLTFCIAEDSCRFDVVRIVFLRLPVCQNYFGEGECEVHCPRRQAGQLYVRLTAVQLAAVAGAIHILLVQSNFGE